VDHIERPFLGNHLGGHPTEYGFETTLGYSSGRPPPVTHLGRGYPARDSKRSVKKRDGQGRPQRRGISEDTQGGPTRRVPQGESLMGFPQGGAPNGHPPS
jgi:hypothetical protein